MKNKLVPVFLGALVFIGLVFGLIALFPEPTSADSIENASLTVSETSWNFGEISMKDGDAIREVQLTNDSLVPITITRLETSCMCTSSQIVHVDGSKSGVKGMVGMGGSSPSLSEVVDVGETVNLIVKFDPNAHGPNGTGPITRNVMLQTNSQDQPEISLTFSGDVVK